MVFVAIVFILFVAILSAIIHSQCSEDDKELYNIGMFLGFLGTIGLVLIIKSLDSNIPTAMDVYRHKTTLEITYKNNVPIDSVVVFK